MPLSFFVVVSLLHATNISCSRIARFDTVYFTVHYLHCPHLCSPLIYTVAIIPLRLPTWELAPLPQSYIYSLTIRKMQFLGQYRAIVVFIALSALASAFYFSLWS